MAIWWPKSDGKIQDTPISCGVQPQSLSPHKLPSVVRSLTWATEVLTSLLSRIDRPESNNSAVCLAHHGHWHGAAIAGFEFVVRRFLQMKIYPSGIQALHVTTILLLTGLAGCQTSNFYYAESMPRSLMLARQSSPQEANLGDFANVTSSSSTIGPGDLLELTISASLDKNDQVQIPFRVGKDGSATIPQIGNVMLAGTEPEAAEHLIRMEAINRGLYRNPNVTLAVVDQKMNTVRVLGAVEEPGEYRLPPGSSDIVAAIAAAGGLAENAGQKVDVRNPANTALDSAQPAYVGGGQSGIETVSHEVAKGGGMTSYSVDLVSASTSSTNSYTVRDGGVVMVEKRDPAPITVTGLVKRPDTYPFPIGKDLTVLGAIAMAGGTSSQVANRVFVIRPLANNAEPAVIEVSIRKSKRSGKSNIRLGPGDTVSVEQTPSTVLLEAIQLIRIGFSGTAGLF